MGIYFGSNFNREPFQYDSVGNHWQQESVTRAQGYQLYHYLQTEEGCGVVSVKGKEILLSAGQGILLAPFVPHSYHAKREGWSTRFATFSGTLEPQLKGMIGSQDYLLIDAKKGAEIAAVIGQAVGEFENASGNSRQLSLSCYQMLLLLYVEDFSHVNVEMRPAWEKYVQPVVTAIETRYMEKLGAEQLAASVYVSPQYLSRLFIRFFKCSVYEYLTNYRINKAKEFLMVRGRKIQDIAHDVGYTDASHFIVMFKKFTGMPPAEFRKLYM